MIRARVSDYVDRVRLALHDSFTQDYTPREIAGSFALGTFITMLPTWGVGVLVFFALARIFAWVNRIALFASVVVFNPVVKWGVYASSFTLGFFLLGPVDGFGVGDVPSTGDGTEILVRLLIGNTILAVVATAMAYFAVHRLVVAYNDRQMPVVEETVEQFVDELEEQTDSGAEDADLSGREEPMD